MKAKELLTAVELYNAVVKRAEGTNECAKVLDSCNDDMAEMLEEVIYNAVECIEIAYVAGLEYKNEKFLEALYILKAMAEKHEIF